MFNHAHSCIENELQCVYVQYIAKLQKTYWLWSFLLSNNILIKNRKT